jgi:alpha-glucosidase
LTLHVYYKNGSENSQLYEDEGDGFGYKKEVYSLKDFELTGSEQMVILTQGKKGQWNDTYHYCNVLFYGLPFQPAFCEVDEADVEFEVIEISGNKVYVLTTNNTFQKIILKL